MGQLHGQYDDPWQHHFNMAAGETEGMLSPSAGMMQPMSESDVTMEGESEIGGFGVSERGYGAFSHGFREGGPSTRGYGQDGGGGGF